MATAATCTDVKNCVQPGKTVAGCNSQSPPNACFTESTPAAVAVCPGNGAGLAYAENCAAWGQVCAAAPAGGAGCFAPDAGGACTTGMSCSGAVLHDCTANGDLGVDCANYGGQACVSDGGRGPACAPDPGTGTCPPGTSIQCIAGHLAQGCPAGNQEQVDCSLLTGPNSCTGGSTSATLSVAEACNAGACGPDACDGGVIESCGRGRVFTYDCSTHGGCALVGPGQHAACGEP